MAILLFMDDVLRNEKNQPIKEGMVLYRTLKEKHRVLIICEDKEKSDHWLRQQRVNNYDDLVDMNETPAKEPNISLRTVEWVRSKGPVEYVITSDPELTIELLKQGITTLVFQHPVYTHDAFRPDSIKRRFKTWAELRSEIEKQQDEYKQDPRRENI